MPIQTRAPGSFTNPDPGQGGDPVTGASTTGHATTSFSGNNSASCLWSGFANVGGVRTSVRLKANHSTNGFLNGGGAANLFTLDYSLNGGGAWLNAFSRGNFTTLSNGSIDIALPVNQDLSQVRVRDRGATSFVDPDTENASIDFSVANIRIEVTTQDPQPIVCM